MFEVESLLLACIREARETIYCESQYFASRTVAEAIAARLRDRDGPEIVIVNPISADGFLEAATMDSARARLLKLVHDADQHDRFRIYTPVTAKGEDIYVHAKILIVDDRLLRIGSSNLNNRSMGFDTECDVAVEAVAGAPDEARLRGGASATCVPISLRGASRPHAGRGPCGHRGARAGARHRQAARPRGGGRTLVAL